MKPVVICGDNRNLAYQKLKQEMKKLRKDGFVLEVVFGDELGDENLISAQIGTTPMFSERKCVVIKYLSDNKDKGLTKKVLKLCSVSEHYDHTRIILFEPYPDSWVIKKARKKMWRVDEYKLAGRREVIQRITSRLPKEQESLAYKLAEQISYQPHRIYPETKKLKSYNKLIGKIQITTLNQLVAQSSETKVWGLINALFESKPSEAAAETKKLLNSQEDPLSIIHLIYSQFRKLLQFSATQNQSQIDSLRIPSFTLSRFQSAKTRLGTKRIQKILLKVVDVEQEIKTGITDPETGLIMVLGHICQRYNSKDHT